MLSIFLGYDSVYSSEEFSFTDVCLCVRACMRTRACIHMCVCVCV